MSGSVSCGLASCVCIQLWCVELSVPHRMWQFLHFQAGNSREPCEAAPQHPHHMVRFCKSALVVCGLGSLFFVLSPDCATRQHTVSYVTGTTVAQHKPPEPVFNTLSYYNASEKNVLVPVLPKIIKDPSINSRLMTRVIA